MRIFRNYLLRSIFLSSLIVLLLFSSFPHSFKSYAALTDGLVAYWNFDEGTGQTVADSSGNSNNGSLGASLIVGTDDPTWTTGKIGGALNFDGLNDFVNVGNSASLQATTSVSVALWVKPNVQFNATSGEIQILRKAGGYELFYNCVDGALLFAVGSNCGSVSDPRSVANLEANTWYHIAGTYDSATFISKLYVNGVEVDSRTDTSGPSAEGGLCIGATCVPSRFTNAVIDEIRVYNRALTLSEIQALVGGLPPTNQPPSVNAGPDQTIVLPAAATLDGTVTDDGLPNPPATTTVTWSKVSGPGTVTFANPNTQDTTATFSLDGTYVLQLSGTDSVLSASDQVSIIVLPSGANPFEEILVSGGLNMPTAMEFAPDGRLFVAEKVGSLRVIKNGVLLATPFVTLPVNSQGERGLLGIAFDPNFATNRYVYVYYSLGSPLKNRVSRFTADSANQDVALPGSELVILDDILAMNGNHQGGAIHFGLNGKLYVAIGDNSNSANAQSLSSLSGKLLRIDPSTFPNIIPPDNPFVGTADARGEIWALGLRNPFTFAIDPTNGKIHINDVGENTWEEVNLGIKGVNYGWPTCEGFCSPSNPNFQDPIHAYNHNGAQAAITGGAFYRGSQFPLEYVGDYFFADYLNGFIKRMKANNQVLDFATGKSGPVDLKVGPDGSLYYLSIFDGAVYKIRYIGSTNHTPIAVASADVTSGLPPLTVNFSGTGSSDPDGDALIYTWNFGDGSPIKSGIAVTHIYTTDGPYNAQLTVDDQKGGTASAVVKITVGNPPTGTITLPSVSTTYNAGDTIFYEGTANDAEDGLLPASAFSWTILFHHTEHTHPFLGPIINVTNGSFTIPTVGEADDKVWYRIYLTVTDSSGLTSTFTRDVLPNKSTMTFDTVPSGLQLTLDGQPFSTPRSVVGVVGIIRTLGVSSPQSLNDKIYEFLSWSDGGTASHAISTPAVNTSYVATFEQLPILFSSNFNTSPDSFAYQDDTFRGTTQPAYASGTHLLTGGFTGGALKVTLGGIDSVQPLGGMSGGWSRTFTLSSPAALTLSFRYNLTQAPDYETDEYSDALMSIDGKLIGTSPNDYLARITGDNNGGPVKTTGWQLFEVNLGTLATGTHTLSIGGYNNKKTSSNEITEALIDDVLLR